ncbi:MAG: 50S ribosomal protein L13 [Candidatus Thorarchaeota archaeon]
MANSKSKSTDKETPAPVEPILVDANNAVAGRLASAVAKQLLQGEHVVVINAEKAVLSGNRASLIQEYKESLGLRTRSAPWRGPLHPRHPDRLLRRIIRGMVPWKKHRGRQAMKRLRVYTGSPEGLTSKRHLDVSDCERKGRRTIYLGEIAQELGWKGVA